MEKFKVKAFQQFLNEFEIEGQHQTNKKYKGNINKIFGAFEKDMESQFGVRKEADSEILDYNEGHKHSEFGLFGDIFCAYHLDPNYKDTMNVSISCGSDEESLKFVKEKLNKIGLGNFIVSAELIDVGIGEKFYEIELKIPVENIDD